MVLRDSFRGFLTRLQPLYDEREATLIASMVFEKATGHRRLDILTRPDTPVTPSQEITLEKMLGALIEKRPVQYVLGEAWFYGFPFQVSEAVLIPRPETEELVQWIVDDTTHTGGKEAAAPVILDIGTGSGCIAVSLKNKLAAARVLALDVSVAALGIARKNATRLETPIEWIEADILDPGTVPILPKTDIIVSNPPYIPALARYDMQPQVTMYEPSQALFVPDDDPLVFYKAILRTARGCFEATGRVYVEVHEDFASEVAALFRDAGGREVSVRADIHERPRMIRATFNCLR